MNNHVFFQQLKNCAMWFSMRLFSTTKRHLQPLDAFFGPLMRTNAFAVGAPPKSHAGGGYSAPGPNLVAGREGARCSLAKKTPRILAIRA